MDTTLVIAGGIALLLAVLLFLPVLLKSRRVNLTETGSEKPEWMHASPPAETQAALKEDNEGMAVYDHDASEKLAAPFVEQIEDILRAKLEADPYLKQFKIDLGTAPDGSLEIWVNDKQFDGLESLPDERLKAAFREAVQQWEQH
ncbi:MAG: hypothetical protein ACOYYU_17295 [Chloroflexota bacterium]